MPNVENFNRMLGSNLAVRGWSKGELMKHMNVCTSYNIFRRRLNDIGELKIKELAEFDRLFNLTDEEIASIVRD